MGRFYIEKNLFLWYNENIQAKDGKMSGFQKLGYVLGKNIGFTVVLAICIVLFLYFSRMNIIEGAIVAVSAMIGYVCARALVLAYKNAPTPKKSRKK